MSDANLDACDRAATLARLETERFDLLVIGGGITGAGIARDAALRGLRVALIEARDYASGTSSRSSKMIHGGLRYLAQGEVALVREAASERQILRRIAPHLTRPIPFVIPTTSLAMTAKLRAGLWSFEKLGGVPAAERHELWNLDELARREPLMRREKLGGAVAYTEFLTDDARLTVANIRSAQEAGAVALNYLAATGIIVENGVAVGVEAAGDLPGETGTIAIRARLIVNAAGPWVDNIRALTAADRTRRLALSKGIHLVVPHSRLPVAATLILRAADKRSIFVVPRDGFTYIGTTDEFHDGIDYWPPIGRAEIDYLLQTVVAGLDVAPIADGDIVALWSGLRPLIAEPGKKANEVSRRDEFWTGPTGIVSIAGGKLSAYRAMAARIVDDAIARLGVTARPEATAEAPLPGGSRAVSGDDRRARLYGDEAASIGAGIAGEAEHAVRCEGAARLEDYWARRSLRAWFDDAAGLAALEPASVAMGALLGWDDARRLAEIARCKDIDRDSRQALRIKENAA